MSQFCLTVSVFIKKKQVFFSKKFGVLMEWLQRPRSLFPIFKIEQAKSAAKNFFLAD